jgi:PAS domain S-box-containing protein
MSQKPTYEELEQRIQGLEQAVFERNRAEEKKRSLELQLSNAVEIAHLGYWEYDVAEDLFTFNDQFYKIFRTSAEQVGKYKLSSSEYANCFVHPEDRYLVGEETRKSIETSDPNFSRQLEHRILYADGEPGYISVRFFIVKDSQGRTERTFGVNQDITDQKKSEIALVESERKWRNILVHVPQIGITLDPEARIVFANEYFLKLTGWEKQEVFDHNWFDLFIPEHVRENVRNIFHTVMGQKNTLGFSTYENEIMDRSGNVINVGWSNVLTKDANGNILDVTCLGVDLTERKRSQKKLQESETKYRTILQSAMDGFWLTDTKGCILEVNEAYCLMSGYSADELLSMRISDLEAVEDTGRTNEHMGKVVVNWSDRFESKHRRKDGAIFDVEVSVQYRPENNGRCICFLRDITERKQAEDELRKNELRYRQYIINAPYGVFVTNEKGQYIQVNPAACRITGYEEQELLAMSIPNLLPEEILDDGLRHFQRLVARGESSGELPFLHKNGEKRWWSVTAVKISDTRFLGFSNDITARKRGEEALKRERLMLARTERIAHVGSWEWDIATDTVTWSDELFRIFQRDPREGAPSFAEHPALYHPDDIVRLRQAVEAAVSKGTPYEFELRAFRKDGQTRICKAHGFSEMGQTGKAVRLFGSLQDITERKKAEESYQTLFREMLDGFALHEIICNETGLPTDYRFLAVNPAFERMTGLKASDIIGRTVLEVIPGTERHWIEIYGRVALTGEPTFFENFAKDLAKYFQVTAFCPEPGQFACIFAEITDRKKAEQEQQKLREQLQQVQKIEAIGTLAGGIAHDFNNILGAILGYAEMAQEDSPTGSLLRKDIDQVVKASHRAKDLVKQILAFSRQTENVHHPMQPAIIVREAMKMLRSSLPSTIVIKQNIDIDSGLILADPTQIHQVVMNLCTNAFHAMEETGGTLSISLHKKTLTDEDVVCEPGMHPGDFVQLSIGDTGPGIAPELWDKIFDPYFTTKEIGKGTGLGLSIIHGIVKSYGGCVSFHSHPGEGTVFHVLLPITTEETMVKGKSEEIAELGIERILFIDDEEILAEMGKSMLERLGYHVTVRLSSLEALATFQNQPDTFDLVITDQTMPGMTGSDLARRILQIRPFMPIILCTGYSSLITEEKAKLLGIQGFAMKPLVRKEIATLIRKVLDDGNVT